MQPPQFLDERNKEGVFLAVHSRLRDRMWR